jgi:membrane-associated protease RseP (regulator of RpoE activity)
LEAALPEQTFDPLRLLLTDVFSIAETKVLDGATEAGVPARAIEFRGQLTQSSDVAYRTLEPRFKDRGYTIVLQHEGGADVVQALHGVEAARPPRLIINVVLLIATIITTLMAGAIISGVLMRSPEVFLRRPALLLEGFPFAFTLLLILGIHEMGHYAAGRFHRTAVTLPYFIPMPPFGALPLGTLGAFIQLRSPIPNRRALFDIGVAGPLAGLVVAIGAFAIGLSASQPVHGGGAGLILGRSIFTQFMIGLFQPAALQPGFGVQMNPILLAGWLGLFITVINLLPIGQLDGGHILYAVMGRRAKWIGFVTIGALVILGVAFGATTWLVWAVLGLLFGVRHAPALDDITPLDPPRKLLALATLVIFVLIFVPVPFR